MCQQPPGGATNYERHLVQQLQPASLPLKLPLLPQLISVRLQTELVPMYGTICIECTRAGDLFNHAHIERSRNEGPAIEAKSFGRHAVCVFST